MRIVITGASSGIGKALYTYFRESWGSSAEVIGVGRNGPDVHVDLATGPGIKTFCGFLYKHIPDVLINNAGMLALGEKGQGMNEDLSLVLLNQYAVYRACHACARMEPGSSIINIASIAGIKAEWEFPLYASTKAAVISLTKSFAQAYADKNIRVNCICPGFFKTNLGGEPAPEELVEKSIQLNRGMADPVEIIPVVDMLLKSTYITGTAITIDGGELLGPKW